MNDNKEVITFEKAISDTENEDRSLLIGNGFSAKYFEYCNLLKTLDAQKYPKIKRLFCELETKDFERVISALKNASQVMKAYECLEYSEKLENDAETVRKLLVDAVRENHPKYKNTAEINYDIAAKFIRNFDKVFSLNYDLLLYWVTLEEGILKDGFGLGCEEGGLRGPFKPDAHCHTFNIHGGLHLFDNGRGEMQKCLNTGDGVIDKISKVILIDKKMPIYVAEGNYGAKLKKINSVPYLRHCYEQLKENASTLFVFGHSADYSDKHIYDAIFTSKVKRIYFGVYQPDEEKLKKFKEQLTKFQKQNSSSIEYFFFRSESAKVWG